jgi:hypothetical protein
VAALVLAVSGCGRRPVAVEGTVTLDGRPLEGVLVTFTPELGEQASVTSCYAVTDKEGRYRMGPKGPREAAVRPGTYRVTLMADDGPEGRPAAQPPGTPGGAPARPPTPAGKLPARYTTLGQTPLRVQVPAEGGTFNLVLTASP